MSRSSRISTFRSIALTFTRPKVERAPLYYVFETVVCCCYYLYIHNFTPSVLEFVSGILGETASAPPEDPNSESSSYAQKIIEESYEVEDLSSPLLEH